MNILQEAEKVIYGDREQTYGNPGKNHRNIADLWETYLRGKGVLKENEFILTHDVAMMMILMKVARLINTPDHRDSLVDICGYAALIERIQNDA